MTPEEWIAHDPDPQTAAELAACGPEELAARFARPLAFGTAGLRGPVRGGPDAMNLAVVLRATWAVAQVLKDLAGSVVIVGRDARHGSAVFATATAEVFAAEGFSVLLLPGPVPTPVVAFAVRHTGAAAGIQITASHNPPADNGYKVYFDGGIQIVSPTDLAIETAMAAAPFADRIAREPVEPADRGLIERYIERAAGVRRSAGSVRVALTPLHGVGGAVAVETLRRAGFDHVHSVGAQFAPGSRLPHCRVPQPRGAGSHRRAAHARRGCRGRRRDRTRSRRRPMRGRDTLISGRRDGACCRVTKPVGCSAITSCRIPATRETAVVASTVVSSRMLAAIAARHGAQHVETLTGFKWLARADENVPAGTLVYAYEEAIGHCVDPAAVRDKDGISAAVLVCDLVAALKEQGRSVPEALDELARRHGVHEVAAVSRRVADSDEAADLMRRLRAAPPDRLAGYTAITTDITDALIFTGGDADTSVRVVVRPSGTEPKLKCYMEVRHAVTGDLRAARERAEALRDELVSEVRQW